MNSANERKWTRRLIRLLHGELPPERARELEQRIARDPEAAALYQRLRESWEGLTLPPSAPVPGGFRAGVMAAVRREKSDELSWSLAPAWARAGAAVALTLGLILGASFGRVDDPPLGEQEALLISEPLSLAESYWLTLEESGAELLDGGEETQ
ncbi:MAG: hypothetical protein GY856_39615 [bacterium]|nr:hypothetical protein [bacterium]